MRAPNDRDYVLGTNDEELERLGLQHRVLREMVLDCWARAGMGPGKRVVDVGCGPGFATVDLAEIVGPTGEVVAVERSSRFARAAAEACERRGLQNVRGHEIDLMTEPIPARDMDFAWCRWVASFVSDPKLLVERIKASLRPGGRAIFHEYAAYESLMMAPPRPGFEAFIREVIASWRDAGGEPDIAQSLIGHLDAAGFSIIHTQPHIFCARPGEAIWQWPSSFVDVNVKRLRELGRIDDALAERITREFREAENDPQSVIITPLVLEIVAELAP